MSEAANTVKTLYNVTRYNRKFNIRHKMMYTFGIIAFNSFV